MITKESGGTILRNYEKPNERKFKAQHKAFPKGTTPILKEAPKSFTQGWLYIRFSRFVIVGIHCIYI